MLEEQIFKFSQLGCHTIMLGGKILYPEIRVTYSVFQPLNVRKHDLILKRHVLPDFLHVIVEKFDYIQSHIR